MTDVLPKSATSQVLDVVRNRILPELRADYPGLTWTFQGGQADMRESTSALWGGFALALGVIFALLAVAFGSYVQPLVVMLAIPFGAVARCSATCCWAWNCPWSVSWASSPWPGWW